MIFVNLDPDILDNEVRKNRIPLELSNVKYATSHRRGAERLPTKPGRNKNNEAANLSRGREEEAGGGPAFNRRLVDTARGSFRPGLPQISRFRRRDVYEACLKFSTFLLPMEVAFLPSPQPSLLARATFRIGIENGPGGARQTV